MNMGLENLEKNLGYSFERKETLIKALTHVSKSEVNNEVFEFLGDSVLSLVISKLLVEKFPKNDEGTLSLMRSKLVSRTTLNKVSKKLDLDRYIVKGDSLIGQETPENILGNALEALFGAIYVESGLDFLEKIIKNLFAQEIESLRAGSLKNSKTLLQEYCQKNKVSLPTYNQIKKKEYKNSFVVLCKLNESLNCLGFGKSLKLAEQDAAKTLLKEMGFKDE